jgi:hypothetical protein
MQNKAVCNKRGRACRSHGIEEKCRQDFLWESKKRKGSQGRFRRRFKDNIKMVFRERVFGDMSWIYVAQCKHQLRALVSLVMNLQIP